MPSMTEDFTRIAEGMAAGHRQRHAMRFRMREMAGERHADVGTHLRDMRTARADADRAHRKAAAREHGMRRHNVAAMMRVFHDALDARRQLRLDMEATARAAAAEFMQRLTSGVAAMRAGFAAAQQERASACRDASSAVHAELAGYAEDRHGAGAAFGGARAMSGGTTP